MGNSKLLQYPPNVTSDMLDVQFWLDKLENADIPLLSSEQIATFNASVHATISVHAVLDLSDTLDAELIRVRITEHNTLPTVPRYGGDGRLLESAYFESLIANATPTLTDVVPVRFGLITRWTLACSYPTFDIATSEPFQFGLDRFQETSVDVGWPVAVVADSQDGEWCFCLTPLYWGWVLRSSIAFGTRQIVSEYVNSESFLVTTASRGLVALAQGGGVTPQMGTRLPLREEGEIFYRVGIPTQCENGELAITDSYINKADGQFSKGCLPCTVRTLFTQAFSLLHEPYAWGDARMGIFGRDCSRFVKDVYGATGVILPRNSRQQGRVGTIQATFNAEMSDEERKALLTECVHPGGLVLMPGHIMLYLEDVDGEPFVIYDTWGQIRRVVVSDLSLGTPNSLLRRLTHAVSITP